MTGRYAFATLVTSDHYLPGALAVAAALKEVHPSPPTDPEVPFQTVCIVTPETVDVKTIKHLRRAFDVVIGVEVIEEQTAAGLKLLGRPDLHTVLTKLHVFRLTQYDKIIFLDADILPIRPLSHLFTLPHEFSAVPDVGWPDIFNSGMMVLTPGEDKFNDIKSLVKIKGTWDGGDQGVLNEWRGNNWNRLSFTYNTTPTSAYEYAPAYERFGSQISALHFIGPNKPWNEIPYRAPSSASQPAQAQQQTPTSTPTPPSSSILAAASPRAYAYPSLVDRWFDVYDRNYRQQNPASEQKFEEKKYESAWNEPVPSHRVPEVTVNALGLEDLRKLAVEGGSSITRQKGEGEYHSLPLEGRIDLMRPKREEPPEMKVEGEAPAPRQQAENLRLTLPEHQQTWQGQAQPSIQDLPTPGPNEIPPSPQIMPVALPSSGPSTPRASVLNPPPIGQASSQSQQPQPPSGPSAAPQAGSGTSFSQDGSGVTSSQSGPGIPSSQPGPGLQPPPSEGHEQQYQHTEPPPPPPPAEVPRPRSPPLLSWNPAIEPPPNVPPTPSAFPSDAYFPNVWDMPTSSAKLHTALTGSSPPISARFFEAPLPSQIPQRLIHEGHYTNVIGSSQHSAQYSHSQPDISKVSTVFPWEEKPRHMPGRVFPGGETAPNVKYIENMPPEPEPVPEVKAEGKLETPRMKIQMPSPPVGFPGASGYSNAWDSVPSIQKYASRLAKPALGSAPPPAPNSPRVRKRSDSYRSRGEQSDANSMDGDVEDEVDDEDSGVDVDSRPPSSERPDRGKARADRPKSGPMSPPSGPSRSQSSKKGYRSYGVQTVPKEVRSVSVQVSQTTSTPTGKSRHSSRQSSASSSPATVAHIDLPRQPPIQEMMLGAEQTALATPGPGNVQSHIRPSGRHHQHGSGMLSPRLHDAYTFESPNRTPPTGSPGTQSPTARKALTAVQPTRPLMLNTQQMQAPPFGIVRTSSTETADSPLGPVSPADSPPGPPPRKPVGRAWNPATGVDVFKRGSEEVLARFLRMGSWEEESQSASPSHRY